MELRRFNRPGGLQSAVLSPDGGQVLTAGNDGVAVLWNAERGSLIRRFAHDTRKEPMPVSAAVAPDGRTIVTGGFLDGIRLWNSTTGAEIRSIAGTGVFGFSNDGRLLATGSRGSFRNRSVAKVVRLADGTEVNAFSCETKGGTNDYVWSAAFSPDDALLATGCGDGTVRLWEIGSGTELRRISGHCDRGPIGPSSCRPSVAFSGDGGSVVVGSRNKTAIYDTKTGAERQRIDTGWVMDVAFSPDGRQVLTASEDGTARLWDASTGAEWLAFAGSAQTVEAVAFSADGRSLVTRDGAGRLWTWDDPGPTTHAFGKERDFTVVVSSPDGKWIVTGHDSPRLLDSRTHTEVRRFAPHQNQITSLSFSPDGRLLLSSSFDRSARISDVETGRVVAEMRAGDAVMAAAFSSDGRRVVTAGDDGGRVWDAQTGKELRRLTGDFSRLMVAAFSPDGRFVLTGDGTADIAYAHEIPTARLWDAQTGKELRKFGAGRAEREITSLGFSPDGRTFLAGTNEGVVRLWDVVKGTELARLDLNTETATSVAFSPDGRRFVAGSGTEIRVYDLAPVKHLATLTSFLDGTWAVVDPQGRYDAANGGEVAGLHWVIGQERLALSQLKERYYHPHLLARVLGTRAEALRDVAALASLKIYPTIQEVRPSRPGDSPTLRLTDRGGGIGRVEISINGIQIESDARGKAVTRAPGTLDLPLDLGDHSLLLPGKDNEVEVRAYNADGSLVSRGFKVVRRTSRKAAGPITLWVVAVGVSDYEGSELDLRFAAKDAEDFAQALSIGGARLLGAERTRVTVLSTVSGRTPPVKKNVVGAIQELRKATGDDVVVIYLAGHGVTHGGESGDYYYLTKEAVSSSLQDPAVRQSAALSAAEIAELLHGNRVAAQKRVLILDTCFAGRAARRLSRDPIPESQVRSLARMRDRTGTWILAGSAADAVSYETSRYNQGLLTHALLRGMRSEALRDQEYVDVATLFSYAEDKVEELAVGIQGIQRPVVVPPRSYSAARGRSAGSFDIGRLTAEDRARVPLTTERPLVVRANFQDEQQIADTLALGELVNTRLRDVSVRGSAAPLVFLDTPAAPDAWVIAGRYRVESSRVTVTIQVVRGSESRSATVTGTVTELQRLADDIVSAASTLIQ